MAADNKYSTNSVILIDRLKKVNGAIIYDGDCSVQVLLPLASGDYLRVGSTDDDCGDDLWSDFYEGLPIAGGINIQTGKPFVKEQESKSDLEKRISRLERWKAKNPEKIGNIDYVESCGCCMDDSSECYTCGNG